MRDKFAIRGYGAYVWLVQPSGIDIRSIWRNFADNYVSFIPPTVFSNDLRTRLQWVTRFN